MNIYIYLYKCTYSISTSLRSQPPEEKTLVWKEGKEVECLLDEIKVWQGEQDAPSECLGVTEVKQQQ